MDALIIASVFQRCQVKKQISILSFAQRGKPPKKARLGPKNVNTLEEEMVEEEETVQVEEEETVQVEEEETVQVEEEEETVEVEEEARVEEMAEATAGEQARTQERIVPGAATYKTSFNSEWISKWPFITVGSTSSYYWCSICRQENSCAHQGVRDVTRHIDSKGYQAKQQALKSTSTINTSNSMTMAYIMGTNTKNDKSPKRQQTPTINIILSLSLSLSLSQIEYILCNWLNCQCHVS